MEGFLLGTTIIGVSCSKNIKVLEGFRVEWFSGLGACSCYAQAAILNVCGIQWFGPPGMQGARRAVGVYMQGVTQPRSRQL